MGIAKQKKGWKEKNINHWVSMSIVSVLSLLSVVFPSRGSCSCLMSPCPHMTCLKNVNYRICAEVVYKQVGGCLISYNLQLVCIRKLEDIWLCYIHLGWFFLQNWQLAFWTIIFCKLTFRTMIPAPLVVVQKKQSRKKISSFYLAVNFFRDLWPSFLDKFRSFPASTLSDCSDCDGRILPKLNHTWNSSSCSLVLKNAVFLIAATVLLPWPGWLEQQMMASVSTGWKCSFPLWLKANNCCCDQDHTISSSTGT